MSAPYPTFLVLAGRRAVVVGGGPVALEKGRALARAGARLRVVAPQIEPELAALAEMAALRAFVPADLDGAWFVVSAATAEVNRAVRAAADERQIFVVAVDDVASCSAIGAAVLERAGLTIAISSGGRAPALVALLRRALVALLPEDHGEWAQIAADARAEWKSDGVAIGARREKLLAALQRSARTP